MNELYALALKAKPNILFYENELELLQIPTIPEKDNVYISLYFSASLILKVCYSFLMFLSLLFPDS